MNEKMNEALEQISDGHLEEAAQGRKKRHGARWLGAIAAVLAVAIAWGAIWKGLQKPTVPQLQATAPQLQATDPAPIAPPSLGINKLAAEPVYPELILLPKRADFDNSGDYDAQYFKWRDQQQALYDQPQGYADSLDSFFARSIPEFLSGEGNRAYSPLTAYLAMAMLAQSTGGNSRQQILDLFGLDSIEALQEQADHVWTAHYRGDGQCSTLLANSLWLDSYFSFKDTTVQTLAQSYYASVFHADLGTEEANQMLRDWLNTQTGGLLQEQAGNLELDPHAVFVLASTCYFNAGWSSKFSPENTADGTFHCKDKDITTPFMNQTLDFDIYYRGTDFGAVQLELNGDNSMWLILPDEGKTVEEVLASTEYWEMTQNTRAWTNKQYTKINLSLPKFDISTQSDLIGGMKNLGIADVFDKNKSDFSPIADLFSARVSKIDHAVRVSIDEEGVVAASYTVVEIRDEGILPLPKDEIDFTLDRPFLFLVTSQDNLPLFTGIVEQPC